MFQCIKKMCFFGGGVVGITFFLKRCFYFNSVFPILINFVKKTIYLFISVYWIV